MTPKQQLEFKAPSHKAGAAVPGAMVSPTPLIGTWTNTNHATNDIVKIIIVASGTGIVIMRGSYEDEMPPRSRTAALRNNFGTRLKKLLPAGSRS